MTTNPKIDSDSGATRIFISFSIVLFVILSGVFIVASFPRFSFELVLGVVVFGIALIFQTIVTFRSNKSSLGEVSVFIFTLIFLWLAPIIQLTELKFNLVNTSKFAEKIFLETNSICAIFSVFFTLGIMKFHPTPQKHVVEIGIKSNYKHINTARLAIIATLLALSSILLSGLIAGGDGTITPIGLFFKKFLFFIPCAAFLGILRANTLNQEANYKNYIYLAILFIGLLITQNPYIEKRNSLGPIYLAVIFIGTGHALRTRIRETGILLIALLIFFPLAALYTHFKSGPGFTFDTNILALISDHFLSTHYDAWANIYSSVELVNIRGVQYGKQITGSLLFFVPSQFWIDKPLATGILLGDFLKENHTMWFSNLSAPLIAEGFIDFHIFGVILYAVILAKSICSMSHIEKNTNSPFIQALMIYGALFLVFLLRGSLMIAFAYGFGGVLAFLATNLIGMRRRSFKTHSGHSEAAYAKTS